MKILVKSLLIFLLSFIFITTTIAADRTPVVVGGNGKAQPISASDKITTSCLNLTGYALSTSIPTNTNQLTNGAGFLTGNQSITLSGDISGTGATAITTTLPDINSNVGTFNNCTVNAKGQVTAASNASYLAPFKFSKYTMSANQTSNLSNTNPVKFNTTQGSLAGLSSHTIALDKTKSYKISWSTTVTFSDAAGNCSFKLIDTANSNAQIGHTTYVIPPTSTLLVDYPQTGSGFLLAGSTNNPTIQLQITSPSNVTNILKDFGTYLIVEEYGGI